MIASIEGILIESAPLQAIVQLQGLSYEIHMPITTTEKLPMIGKPVKLHTFVVYREDAQTMYGFYSKPERDFFRLLVEKVSGVGPKVALSIMSKLSLETLKLAITQSNIALLSECPGIGKKTAERLIIELRDKIKSFSNPIHISTSSQNTETTDTSANLISDAISALIALGYKPTEADKSVRKALSSTKDTPSIEGIIKKALNG